MSILNKLKILAQEAIHNADEVKSNLTQDYKNGGASQVGKTLGVFTKKVFQDTSTYIDNVSKENKKFAKNAVKDQDPKESPAIKELATISYEVLHGIRTVANDALNKAKEIDNKLEEKLKNKP